MDLIGPPVHSHACDAMPKQLQTRPIDVIVAAILDQELFFKLAHSVRPEMDGNGAICDDPIAPHAAAPGMEDDLCDAHICQKTQCRLSRAMLSAGLLMWRTRWTDI